ncbi:MAG: HesA/MoeB/ThiF family protein [Bacillota bacterium]
MGGGDWTEEAVAALRSRSRREEAGHLVVSDADLESVASQWGKPVLQIEHLALAADMVPARYLRNVGAVGTPGQMRLLDSRATVVGLGGAGGLVAEILARAGVGTLVLVDPDCFEESNLNRQVLATRRTLGRPKAEVARERVHEINPHLQVVVRCQALTADNARAILQEPAGASHQARVVVDCLDSGRSRLVLQAACRELGLPLVHGAIRGWQGRVLLVLPGGPGLECFYREDDVPSPSEVLGSGAPAPTPALMAAWQAGQAVRVLLGDTSSAGQVFTFDLRSGQAGVVPFVLARMSAAWWRRRGKRDGQAGPGPFGRGETGGKSRGNPPERFPR